MRKSAVLPSLPEGKDGQVNVTHTHVRARTEGGSSRVFFFCPAVTSHSGAAERLLKFKSPLQRAIIIKRGTAREDLRQTCIEL